MLNKNKTVIFKHRVLVSEIVNFFDISSKFQNILKSFAGVRDSGCHNSLQ